MSEWRQGEVDSTEASGTVVIKPLGGQGQREQAPAEAEEEEEEDEGNAKQPYLHVSLSLRSSAVIQPICSAEPAVILLSTHLGGGSSLWSIQEVNQAHLLASLHQVGKPLSGFAVLPSTVHYLHFASTS